MLMTFVAITDIDSGLGSYLLDLLRADNDSMVGEYFDIILNTDPAISIAISSFKQVIDGLALLLVFPHGFANVVSGNCHLDFI